MAKHLKAQDVPEAAKTVSVDVYSKVEGSDINNEPALYEKTGTRDVGATYFWQTPDGRQFVGQATAQEKGMFDIGEDAATIQVNKYSINGDFLGGPWQIKDV